MTSSSQKLCESPRDRKSIARAKIEKTAQKQAGERASLEYVLCRNRLTCDMRRYCQPAMPSNNKSTPSRRKADLNSVMPLTGNRSMSAGRGRSRYHWDGNTPAVIDNNKPDSNVASLVPVRVFVNCGINLHLVDSCSQAALRPTMMMPATINITPAMRKVLMFSLNRK